MPSALFHSVPCLYLVFSVQFKGNIVVISKVIFFKQIDFLTSASNRLEHKMGRTLTTPVYLAMVNSFSSFNVFYSSWAWEAEKSAAFLFLVTSCSHLHPKQQQNKAINVFCICFFFPPLKTKTKPTTGSGNVLGFFCCFIFVMFPPSPSPTGIRGIVKCYFCEI